MTAISPHVSHDEGARSDDGVAPGVSSGEAARVRELEQEVRELRRANEVLKRAASFFGAELDRHYRK